MLTETYTTLCFNTEKQASKQLVSINMYFKNRLVSSEILKGTDERGIYGFYVKYILTKNVFSLKN